MNGARFEPGNFLHRRFAQAQDDVAGADERLVVGRNRRAGLGVGLVRKTGGGAKAGLNLHLRAELDEPARAVGRHWSAVLAGICLSWN